MPKVRILHYILYNTSAHFSIVYFLFYNLYLQFVFIISIAEGAYLWYNILR